jgi:hypothetical protein
MNLEEHVEILPGVTIDASENEDDGISRVDVSIKNCELVDEINEMERVFRRIETSRDLIDTVNDPRSEPQIIHFADSFYQSTAYWFLIRPSTKGWIYMLILVAMLFLQICALFGYLSSGTTKVSLRN